MQNTIVPAIAAIVFNEANEVLLQKRRDTGKWCVISGHVEFGESLEQAVHREIMEEINTPAEIVRFIGIYSSPQHQIYVYEDKKIQYVLAYFEVKLQQRIADSFSSDETLELKYFNINDLPPDMDKINPHWLEDALSKSRKIFVR